MTDSQGRARDALSSLVRRYGADISDDPRRVGALIRDLAPGSALEATLVQLAAEEGIPRELVALSGGGRPDITTHVTLLAKRLERNRGLTEANAIWAVRAWMYALSPVEELGPAGDQRARGSEAGPEERRSPDRRWFAGRRLVIAGVSGLAVASLTLVLVLGLGRGGAHPTKAAGTQAPPARKPIGREVFTSAGCGACHTLRAAGATGTVGPNLDDLKPSKDIVVRRVTSGGAIMPSFKRTLSRAEIEAVAAYVSSVAGS